MKLTGFLMVVNENLGYYFGYKKVLQTAALYTTDVITLISRRNKVAIFADIIKIVAMSVTKICRGSK